MASQRTLVVVGQTGVMLVPLPWKGSQLFVGRDAFCEVHLADEQVSRQHARLTRERAARATNAAATAGAAAEATAGAAAEATAGAAAKATTGTTAEATTGAAAATEASAATETTMLADLGSRNGTSVDGQRVDPASPVPLAVGSVVRIGNALLVIEDRRGPAQLRLVAGVGALVRCVDDEIARATAEGATFALVEVRLEGGEGRLSSASPHDRAGHPATPLFYAWQEGQYITLDAEHMVSTGLRDGDVLAPLGEGVWLALLPNATPARARQQAARLALLLEEAGFQARVRLALFPDQGTTSDALLLALGESGEVDEAARADEEGEPGEPGEAAEASETGEPGEAAEASEAGKADEGEDQAGPPGEREHAEKSPLGEALKLDDPGPSGWPELPTAPLGAAEIADLAARFVALACEARQRPDPPRLSPQALAWLEADGWPGDEREFHDVIERAVMVCDEPVITLEHLPLRRWRRSSPQPSHLRGETADFGRGYASPEGGY